MPAPSPDRSQVLTRVAELRAGGLSWEAVAREVGESANNLRRWTRRAGDRWGQLLRAAERELLRESGAEAVLVLRQLLRATDEKVRRDAAKLLLDRCAEAFPTDPADAAPPSHWQALARYLESLDADQLPTLDPKPRRATNPETTRPARGESAA